MKIGVISDVHSNVLALNAVLEEFETRKIDKIICCGDVIGIGPKPEETIKIIMDKKDKMIIVRGNHEMYLLNGLPEKTIMPIEQIKHHKWIHSELSQNSKDFIKTLPISEKIEVGNKEIFIVHYPMNENGEYKEHIKKANIDEIERLYSDVDADIFLYGHTHTTSINNKNDKWYINPGSLGCPSLSNVANAGIINIEEEKVEYEQLAIKYDIQKVIGEIESVKYPDYEEVLSIFYGVNK